MRQILRKFIDQQMQPGDLVALWETGRNNSVFQQFTSDKRVLAAAVKNLRWNPRGLGLVDRLRRITAAGRITPESVLPNGRWNGARMWRTKEPTSD